MSQRGIPVLQLIDAAQRVWIGPRRVVPISNVQVQREDIVILPADTGEKRIGRRTVGAAQRREELNDDRPLRPEGSGRCDYEQRQHR
jgi:hypothetical protein